MVVNDVGSELEVLCKDEGGLGEKYEALRLIEVIPLGSAVEIFAIEKLLAADEVDGNLFRQFALVEIGFKELSPERDFDLLSQVFDGQAGLPDHPVEGHH